ncbi:MAG: gamma-glutamyl-gamma-aminobutyrate hydrolase family protein [Nitrososphaerales archaeon]|nr:gamma-glutamyl-gamma-aminobutyrate hydrolase family protein [Nitrososphaerales archaeon]
MVRVLAVNNYPSLERFWRLKNSLEANGAKVSVGGWRESSAKLFNGYDGVVLSGAPDMLSEERTQRKFSAEAGAVIEARVPVLGICFGHQLIGRAFGSNVVKNGIHTLKFVETEVLARDPLFAGLLGRMTVFESHHEAVETLPERFRLLAKSPSSAIATMRHSSLPIYGLQFHPERNSPVKPDGNLVVSNFVRGLA